MRYQSPDDRVMVAQLPTTDWRDEHWVYGYGLYVNALVHAYLPLYGCMKRPKIRAAVNRPAAARSTRPPRARGARHA